MKKIATLLPLEANSLRTDSIETQGQSENSRVAFQKNICPIKESL